MSVLSDEKKHNHRRCLNNSEKEDKWTGTEDGCISSTGWVSRDPWPNDSNTQQHTPNKLSKIEIKSSANSSLHETSSSGHDLKLNEDYFIDFENDHISQYGVITSEIENKTNGQSCIDKSACPTPGISQSRVYRTSSIINQWKRAGANTKPADKALNKCEISYPQTSGSETLDNFTDYRCYQELCSHYVCCQQPALTSLSVSGYSARRNQEYQQDTQFDPSLDQGYGSHSTGSSYQGQDSEKEGSVMEQGSQMDLGVEDRGWSAGLGSVGDNSGENDLEDLLYHFQNFFQDRFESEFRRYQEAVYGIIQEQQNHVRQIVHTTLREQSSSQKSHTEEFPSEDTKKMPRMLKAVSQQVEPSESTVMILESASISELYSTAAKLFKLKTQNPQGSTRVLLADKLETRKTSSAVKEETVQKRLLDLYSLSCSVSTLLAQYQFKS